MIIFNNILNELSNECICYNIINNKIHLYDYYNNIKINIKKIIEPESKNGKFILDYLGYSIEKYVKIILKCKYLYKSNKCFNLFNNSHNVLFIIIGYEEPVIIYKYIIDNNNYKYNNTLISQ